MMYLGWKPRKNGIKRKRWSSWCFAYIQTRIYRDEYKLYMWHVSIPYQAKPYMYIYRYSLTKPISCSADRNPLSFKLWIQASIYCFNGMGWIFFSFSSLSTLHSCCIRYTIKPDIFFYKKKEEKKSFPGLLFPAIKPPNKMNGYKDCVWTLKAQIYLGANCLFLSTHRFKTKLHGNWNAMWTTRAISSSLVSSFLKHTQRWYIFTWILCIYSLVMCQRQARHIISGNLFDTHLSFIFNAPFDHGKGWKENKNWRKKNKLFKIIIFLWPISFTRLLRECVNGIAHIYICKD